MLWTLENKLDCIPISSHIDNNCGLDNRRLFQTQQNNRSRKHSADNAAQRDELCVLGILGILNGIHIG